MTTNRIWALGTVLGIVAALALGWLLGVSPMLARLETAKAELAVNESNNAAQTATLTVMKAQYEDIAELTEELDLLRVSIPGTPDSEFVYALLSEYQVSSEVRVESIITGEAQPYGLTAEGAPTVEGVATVPNLYTVPITVTFKGASAAGVLGFVTGLQRGPRLFLVTSIVGGEGDGDERTSTVTGFMFVLADPDAESDDALNTLLEHPFDPAKFAKPLGSSDDPNPTPSPTPTPAPTESATPTPSPTSTTGP